MKRNERYDHLAVTTADSIFDDFAKSLSRVGALFGSPEKALHELIFPEIKSALGISIGGDISNGYAVSAYAGEIRNIGLMFHSNDQPWVKTITDISEIAGRGDARKIFKPGDYFFIPVCVPEVVIDDVLFPEIKDDSVKVVATAVFDDKVIFNFENVLFHAAMNREATNKGGFSKTVLAKYLNDDYFLKCVFGGFEDYLLPNKDGLKISLPTLFEVFGGEKDKTVNWGETVRHPYFEKCTNRIKVGNNDPDDTNWWWNSTPCAANTGHFCYVNYNGIANNNAANNTSGGVSPAFCVCVSTRIIWSPAPLWGGERS